MRALSLALMGIVLCLSTPRHGAAQSLRGLVRDAATMSPLAGAVVTTIDSTGRSLRSTLTDSRGAFVIELSGLSAKLRVVRLGFRPQLANLDGSIRQGTIDMARLPALLEGVRVTDRAACPGSEDRAGALAHWERAREGILAAITTRDARPAVATSWAYQRVISLKDDRVVRHTSRRQTGRSSRPFRAAATPRQLADSGYSRDDGTGREYLVPDADVLFDESFAATHCFGVVRDSSPSSRRIGVSFEPVPGGGSKVDVSGRLWLMADTNPTLDAIAFRYTGLGPAAERTGSGGEMSFVTLPNGSVIIERWSVRIPIFEEVREVRGGVAARAGRGVGAIEARTVRELRVTQVSESGGLLLNARWDDGASWSRDVVSLAGRVHDEESRRPIAGVRISLGVESDEVLTDADGRFAFSPILPGNYMLAAVDSSLSALSSPREAGVSATVARGAHTETVITVPSRRALVAKACARDGHASGAYVWGRLHRTPLPEGLPIAVRGEWLADVLSGGAALTLSARMISEAVEVREDGMFHFCGIPEERPVRLVFTLAGVSFADTVVTVVSGASFASVVWQLPAQPRDRSAMGELTLRGTVRRSRDAGPIAGADVWLPALDLHAVTDSAGRFHIPGVTSGRHLVQIRRLGFLVRRDTITLTGDRGAPRDYVLGESATELDTVRTVSSQIGYGSPALRRFEERRAQGFGYFIGATDLRKQDEKSLSSILTGRVAGVSLIRGPGGATLAVSSRKMCPYALAGCSRPSCFVSVYVDGVLIYSRVKNPNETAPDLSRYRVRELAGVEFYPSTGVGPAEFNITDAGCGALFLWTREG